MKEIKEFKKEEIENMNKESRVILFLLESKNKNKEEIENLYLNKYKLSEKSNKFNERVINRVFGEDFKYSDEKSKEKIRVLKENLIKCNIDFKELVKRKIELKEKMKRRNKLNLMIDLKDLVVWINFLFFFYW